MKARRITVSALAAATLLTTALAGGLASPAQAAPGHQTRVTPNTFTGYETGYGATLAIAENNASNQMNGDYGGCVRPYTVVSYSQLADGSWTATLAAQCKTYR